MFNRRITNTITDMYESWKSDINCSEVAVQYAKRFSHDQSWITTWWCDRNFERIYIQCRIVIMEHTKLAIKTWEELAQEEADDSDREEDEDDK